MIIFEKEYSDESLIDASEDICESVFDDKLNLPQDEYGFRKGIFKITITWEEE